MPSPGPIRDAFQALATAGANPGLRLLNAAWAGSISAEYLALTAFGIYGFGADGARGVGLVAVAQMLPALLVAPFAAALGDRMRRERVLVCIEVVRGAAALVAGLAVVAETGSWAVYLLAAVLGASRTAYYPAQSALVPLLARDTREVTATGASLNLIKNVANLAAPATAGLLLLAAPLWSVFAVAGGLSLAAAALVAVRMPSTAGLRTPARAQGAVRGLARGLAAVRREPALRLPILLCGAQGFGRGAINVLVIVLPLQLLGLGDSGAGFYSALIGLGGIIGVGVSIGLVGQRTLAVPMALGLLGMGLPYLLPAAAPVAWAAAAALLVAGIGNAVMGVTGLSLLVRESRDDVLARVMGVQEVARAAGILAASLGVPALAAALGLRMGLVVLAAVVAAGALAALPQARRLDRDAEPPAGDLDLLSASPVFGRLLPVSRERAARRMRHRPVAAGEVLIREGDRGDRVFLAVSGVYEVTAAGRPLNTLRRGDVFGEIALLHDTPRTATVRALEDGEVMTLDRSEFLSTVLGQPMGSADARALADGRLARGRA